METLFFFICSKDHIAVIFLLEGVLEFYWTLNVSIIFKRTVNMSIFSNTFILSDQLLLFSDEEFFIENQKNRVFYT